MSCKYVENEWQISGKYMAKSLQSRNYIAAKVQQLQMAQICREFAAR
jgi:hypothetical protein